MDMIANSSIVLKQQGGAEAGPQTLTGVGQIATPFDYGSLDANLAQEVREVVMRYRHRTQTYIFDTGRDLQAIKDRLGHGRFTSFVEAELGLSVRTAQHFMRAVDRFGHKSEIISRLPPTLIYKLSEEDTPEAVRMFVISRLEEGVSLEPKAVFREIRLAKDAKLVTSPKTEVVRRANLSDEQIAGDELFREQSEDARENQARKSEQGQGHLSDAEIEGAAASLLEHLPAAAIREFSHQYGHSLPKVFARAFEMVDIQRALGEPSVELPVGAIKLAGLISRANKKDREKWQMGVCETAMMHGAEITPIVVVKAPDERYILIDGPYSFWVLTERCGRSMVPVHIVPAKPMP